MNPIMKKLFSPSRIKVFVITVTVLVLGAVFFVALRTVWGSVKQPISFNHKIHAENELECLDCHLYFNEHASSGNPSLEICSGCHEEPQGTGAEEQKVVDHVTSGKEIEWKRLYRVPEDVYFSHKRHVVLGELECNVCHGDIGESTKPPARASQITMGECMKCHEEKAADNDCIACHK
jgi:hypothetical protein